MRGTKAKALRRIARHDAGALTVHNVVTKTRLTYRNQFPFNLVRRFRLLQRLVLRSWFRKLITYLGTTEVPTGTVECGGSRGVYRTIKYLFKKKMTVPLVPRIRLKEGAEIGGNIDDELDEDPFEIVFRKGTITRGATLNELKSLVAS